MTTIDLFEPLADQRRHRRNPAILAGIGRLWASMRKRSRQRQTMIALSRMDARLLRDVGIEPLDVTDAINRKSSSVMFNPIRKRADHE